jgi:hypothetical protein
MNISEEEYVICPLCNKKFKCITTSHLKTHKISYKEFRLLYPTISLVCVSKKRLMSKTSKEHGCGKWMKGYKHTIEQRQKMAKRVSGANNPFFGKKHSKIAREKMSKNHADFTGDKNPLKKFLKNESKHRDYCLRIKNAKEDFKKNTKKYAKWKDNISRSIVQGHINGVFKPYGRGHKQGSFYSKLQNKKICFRSSYEERFLIWCEKMQVSFNTCKISIKYKDKEEKNHRYLPDFSVFYSGIEVVVEIKPENLINLCLEKIEAAKKFFSKQKDKLYVVLILRDIEELEQLTFFDLDFFLRNSKNCQYERI